MEKKPKTLKGWQKLYPDAMRIKGTSKYLLSNKQIIELAYGAGAYGKVLLNNSWGTMSLRGNKFNINAIVSQHIPSLIEAGLAVSSVKS